MWLQQQVSLYKTHADNTGITATLDEILYWRLDLYSKPIFQLRKLDKSATDYEIRKKALKAKLQCYTPAALLGSKAKDSFKLLTRTNIMQFDFDYADIADYDIEELKRAVFELPFIGYCGLSCSGDGFYALALIDEPERLPEYAEHCFNVFESSYCIKVDTSKGRNANDLRYVSYDANPLIRESPVPLKINKFYTTQQLAAPTYKTHHAGNNDFVQRQLDKIINSYPGNRTNIIKNVAQTLAGKFGDYQHLQEIKNIIYGSQLFADDVRGKIRTAEDCFKRGLQRPF